jgi:cell division protein FtsZ
LAEAESHHQDEPGQLDREEVAEAPGRAPKAPPRMPRPEDFPPIAQRQMQARQAQVETIAEHSQKRRRGLLERLAIVGLGRREEVPVRKAVRPVEPAVEPRAEPKFQAPAAEDERPAAQPAANVHPLAPHIEPEVEDDQLEIPAFLRRQAN